MPLNGSRFLPTLLQKSTTVVFKIDCEWHEIRFDRLNSIQASIKRLLDLQPYTLYLRSVQQGCVELVFEVPQHVADVIFPPTEEQLLALQEHNITYCGELLLRACIIVLLLVAIIPVNISNHAVVIIIPIPYCVVCL